MNWFAEHWLHVTLIAAYLAILVHHAREGRRHVRSVSDYLTAGRRLGGVVIALSFYATFMSTNTLIGAAGKSWNYGLTWMVGGLVLSGLACMAWFVVAPRFVPLTKEYHSLTVADFLGSHYQSHPVRRMAAGIVAMSSLLYLVAIYRGASLALQGFLDLPYAVCVISVLVIVTFYTLLGGFESVVMTDALQGTLMLVGAVALVVAVVFSGGGMETMLQTLKREQPQLVEWNTAAFSATMAYSLAVGVKYLVEPRQLSRFYGLKDQRALRTASWLAPVAIAVSYLCLLPLGALARAILPSDAIQSTDEVIPTLLADANVLGVVVGTLFLLVLISAAMSSIDSVLLVAASTIQRDLLAGEDSHGVYATRRWVVIVSVSSAAVALTPYTNDIVQMTKFSGSLYGACFVPVLVLGLFVSQRSSQAALATMGIGSATVIVFFVMRKLEWTRIQEVYPGMAAGLLTYLLLHYLAQRRNREYGNSHPHA